MQLVRLLGSGTRAAPASPGEAGAKDGGHELQHAQASLSITNSRSSLRLTSIEHSRLPRGVRPRLEGKPRTPLSSRVATRVSWSPLSGLKGP